EYHLTWILGTFRHTEYTRLSRNASQHEVETYVDYMCRSLYPESFIRVHTEFLVNNALDNDSDEYTVIFAPSAPGALKLVGEAHQF
ncbi:MAG: hypothetical protein NXY57DRAFT_864183, partial [Lentinula lateritia]